METQAFDNKLSSEENNGILTMAFVNFQPLNEVYTATEAFEKGSLFPNLDKPLRTGGARN